MLSNGVSKVHTFVACDIAFSQYTHQIELLLYEKSKLNKNNSRILMLKQ